MIIHINNQIFNHIYSILVAVAITSLIAGCSEDVIISNELISDAPGTITLRFKNSEMTRSTDSEASEVRIDNLVIGLYPIGYDETSAPVFWDKFDNLNASSNTTVTLQLTKGMVTELFRDEDGAECRLFVLANVPNLQNLPSGLSIAQMKALTIESDFDVNMVQDNFIMYGDDKVTYSGPETSDELGKAVGNIYLYRAASKIILKLNLPKIEIKDNNGNVVETWESVTDGSRIMATLNNGVKKSITCPLAGADNQPWKPTDTQAYYSGNLGTDGAFRKFKYNSSSDPDYPYSIEVPFYTYPNSWSETLNETHKTTITLCVPWKRVGSDDYQTFYYQVPVTQSDITFISNNHAYTIKLKVGMLGSSVPDEPELLTDMSYNIVDWGNEELSVKIDDIRYLVVSPTEYVVNNEEEISIPFYTSHPVEISDYEITYPQFNVYGANATEKRGLPVDIIMKKEVIDASVYSPNDNVTEKIATFQIAQDPQTNQMILKVHHELVMWNPYDSEGKEVKLVEQINNDTETIEEINNSIVKYTRPNNPSNAYYPYTIRVTIRHKDEAYKETYKETVTITQYPGMYISVDRNAGGSYYSAVVANIRPWDIKNRSSLNHGYAFVNPYEEVFNGEVCWVNDRFLGGLMVPYDKDDKPVGTLVSPCMYIIHVTQFDPSMSDEYVIGNPRSKLINNMNYTELTDEQIEQDLNIQDSAPADKWILKKIGGSAATDEMEGWCREADALYPDNSSTKRTLEFYYPTIESEETMNMVAPLYRFASSYGTVGAGNLLATPNTRKLGRRRIATYQERQFASGRWRLPTYGELRLIVWLSVTQKIPTLFNDSQDYLTAQGVYKVITKGTNKGALQKVTDKTTYCNARGVYDDWYWDEEKNYILQSEEDGSYRYTLGDMPQNIN